MTGPTKQYWKNEILGENLAFQPQEDAALYLWAVYYLETDRYDAELAASQAKEMRIEVEALPKRRTGTPILMGGYRCMSSAVSRSLVRKVEAVARQCEIDRATWRWAKERVVDLGQKGLEQLVANPPSLIRDLRLTDELRLVGSLV